MRERVETLEVSVSSFEFDHERELSRVEPLGFLRLAHNPASFPIARVAQIASRFLSFASSASRAFA